MSSSTLLDAATLGDLSLLERTLAGEFGKYTDEEVGEALIRAASHGKVACVTRLLAHGADPDCEDFDGDTPLMLAAANNRTVDDSKTPSGGRHVHVDTVTENDEEIVKLLIERGCDVNSQSDRGSTALHMAVWHQRRPIVLQLLNAHCLRDLRDRYGDTPLMLAAKKGHTDILKDLLSAGSDIIKVNDENFNALHFAAQQGHVECVKLLLAKGSPLEDRTVWSSTPLLQAASNGCSETCLVLIAGGANINARDRVQRSVLHHAVRSNLLTLAEWLLELCVGINSTDGDGNTPLMDAVNARHGLMVRLLVRYGCEVRIVGRATLDNTYCWCTPLEVAVYRHDLPSARLLHAAGCRLSDCLNPVTGYIETGRCPNAVKDWLARFDNAVPSLVRIVRICIRDQIGSHLKDKVNSLPLPPVLKNFLAFNNDAEFDT